MIPLISWETSFGRNVNKLVFGVKILDLDFGVQVDPIKQPSSWSRLGYLQNVQLRFSLKRTCVGGYMIYLFQSVNLLLWRVGSWFWNHKLSSWAKHTQVSLDLHGWVGSAQVSPELVWPSWMLSLVARSTSITMSHMSRASTGSPSIRRASRKMISDSVELSKTDVFVSCTSNWLEQIHKTPPEVDFESSRSLAKVWLLKQTHSAVPCRVSHMTMLTIVINVMNVWNQPCHLSHAWAHFVTNLANLLTTWCQVDQFVPNASMFKTICEQTSHNSPTDSQFLLSELMVIHARIRNFTKLLHFLVRQFTVSFNTFLSRSFHVTGPRCCLREIYLILVIFLLLQQKYVIRTFLRAVQ